MYVMSDTTPRIMHCGAFIVIIFQRNLVPQPSRVKYVGSNDELILEDQMQRVTLTGNISTEEMITGVVAALLGKELRNGCFEVDDYCFAGLPAQEELNAMETDGENK